MVNVQATIPILYRSVDMDGIIRDCNMHYAMRLGYTVEEVIGASVLDHTTERYRKEMVARIAKWRDTPATNISKKNKLMTKGGDVIDVLQVVRKRYQNNEVIGMDVDMRDVSVIKAMQDLYDVDSRDDYEDPDILRRSVDYIGTIVDCSQSYLDNLGYAKDEVIGISLYEHTAPRSKGNLHANMENWRAGYRDAAVIWMLRKDGTEFPTTLTAADELNEDGVVVGRTVALKLMDV